MYWSDELVKNRILTMNNAKSLLTQIANVGHVCFLTRGLLDIYVLNNFCNMVEAKNIFPQMLNDISNF